MCIRDSQSGFRRFGKAGGLREGQVFFLPRERRGDEKINVQIVQPVPEIDGVGVFGVVLNACLLYTSHE